MKMAECQQEEVKKIERKLSIRESKAKAEIQETMKIIKKHVSMFSKFKKDIGATEMHSIKTLDDTAISFKPKRIPMELEEGVK